ncbi:hypothetical protein ARC20_12140 [Stenotrophomonas panacihumi]|uniref:DUF2242 domain-containing protein n=1 Tax=Stenotrophomonas panacihumi TaxID=676599 RepID=A0A0R0AI91_9GAMM|nr:DUF2242 domain-containing protein [Stenotrophomonas panacihumi]KRG40980.1 hypothetical protein ARC20_12140 [Stenotrophomonas panacihumi]PTN53860.1 DUF2242 domain-containing protein [Stenotrophomonas panacihumi]
MIPSRRIAPVLACLGIVVSLAGCGRGKADHVLVRESFNSDNTYSRNFEVAPAAACEAARRALLSQGYIVARADAAAVEGSKNFQPTEESHEQLDLRISCVAQDDHAWVFVSAVQDRYALKKSATSASVGVGVLGSVSLPVGSSNDSMVRVASVTVQDADFYKRFFERLAMYLPKPSGKPSAQAAPPPPPPPAPPAPVAPAPEVAPEVTAPARLPAPPPVTEPAPSAASSQAQDTKPQDTPLP